MLSNYFLNWTKFLCLFRATRTKRYFVSTAYGKVSDKEPPLGRERRWEGGTNPMIAHVCLRPISTDDDVGFDGR
jgi:hypothetical protein